MDKNKNQGTGNVLRGDPINGPHNSAMKSAPPQTNSTRKGKSEKKQDINDSETDGGYMLTSSEVQDFSEGTDSWT